MSSTYRPQAQDTSIEADRHLFTLLAQRSNEERMAMTARHTLKVLHMSLAGLKSRFGHLPDPAFAQKVAQTWLSDRWPVGFEITGNPMTWIQDSTNLAQRLHNIFETLGIVYYITGGVAATAYGEPRSTIDLDLVINVSGRALYPLVESLEADGFYVPGIEDTVAGRMKTLQITDQATIDRADLVVASNEPWENVKFGRRQIINGVYLASPEDVILNKLRWGQNSQSEKQWRDVLGVLKVQGNNLDFDYLQQWANTLGLASDLTQACQEAGLLP